MNFISIQHIYLYLFNIFVYKHRDDFYPDEEDEGPIFGNMAAPQLDLGTIKNQETDSFYPHNGHSAQHTPVNTNHHQPTVPHLTQPTVQHQPTAHYAAPTPREFNFHWDATPRHPSVSSYFFYLHTNHNNQKTYKLANKQKYKLNHSVFLTLFFSGFSHFW